MKLKKKIFITVVSKWFEITAMITFNLIAVPIFILKWGVENYAYWLLFQVSIGLIFLPNLSLSEYVYNKNFAAGKKKKFQLFSNILSSIPFCFFNSLLIIGLLLLDKNFLFTNKLLNISNKNFSEWNFVLIIFAILVMFSSSITNFFTDMLKLMGFYHFFSIGNTIRRIANMIVPLILVFFYNFKLFETIISVALIDILYFIFIYIILFFYLKKQNISFELNLTKGLIYYLNSFIILFKHIFENFSTQGLRYFISFLFNPLMVVTFSTIRTVSNIYRQFIDGMKEFFIPEFSLIFIKKDKIKLNYYIEIYLILLFLFLFPSLIIIQILIPDLFILWTMGKVDFNSLLFLFLNFSLMIYAIYNPLKLILISNNLNYTILFNSIAYFLVTIFFIFFFNKSLSLTSVGLGICIAEILIFIIVLKKTNILMKKINIKMNVKIFYLSFLSLLYIFILCFLFVNNQILNFKFLDFILFFLIYFILGTLMIKNSSNHTKTKIKFLLKL